jgi:iron complex transport system substrate-binding protein
VSARLRLAALLLALLAAVPLARADAPPEPQRIRVATLVPYAEDALRRVPGHVEIVATVRRSLHEPVAAGTVDLGNPHAPSFEALAQARPALVVGDALIHRALEPKLARLGAETFLLDAPTVEATFSELERLGVRVGAAREMGAAVAEARGALGALALSAPLPTLALFGTPASFFAVTGRTWLGDLLARLNFENLGAEQRGDERFPGFVALSDETLALLRPQLVVLVAHGDPRAVGAALRERIGAGGPWRSVRESAGDNVHVLDSSVFAANPGLAIPDAARELVALAGGSGS